MLVLFLVGAVLAWWWLAGYRKEGFTDDQDTNMFHYQLFADPPTATSETGKRVIPVNPGVVPLSDLDKTVEAAGIFGPLFKDFSLSKFFYERTDPTKESDATCQGYGHPRNLDNTGLEESCGWWFVEDPSVTSTAAFGTPEGPAPTVLQDRLLNQHPGGVWLWDLAEAAKREDMKRCRQIRTCSFVEGSDLGVQCAYCPDLGYAIPVDGQGQPKYPYEAAANCVPTSLVTKAENCPTPSFVPRLIGVDYEYDLNGNVVRSANTDARLAYEEGKGIALQDVCEPVNGRLARDCLLSLAESAGCTKEGGMMRILTGGGHTSSETDRIALDVLDKQGALLIPNTFWTGDLTAQNTSELLSKLYTLSIAAPSLVAKDAAIWMLRGGDFDVCTYKDSDTGPFRIECVQREFRKAGCQPAGAAYPTDRSLQALPQGTTLAALKTQFRDLYDSMDINKARTVQAQDEAVHSCLGITVQRVSDEAVLESQPGLCQQQGVLYEVFEIPAAEDVPRVFLGRHVSTRGFDYTHSTLGQLLGRVREGARGMLVARTTYMAAPETTVTLMGAGFTLKRDGEDMFGNADGSWTLQIPAKTPTKLEVVYKEASPRQKGAAVFPPQGPTVTSRETLQRLYLPYASWRPSVALGARAATFQDEHGLLDLAGDSHIVTLGQRTAASLTATPIVSGGRMGFQHASIGTLSVMMYLTSITDQVTLFRLDQGTEGSSAAYIALQLQERRPVLTLYQGQGGMIVLQGTRTIETRDLNTWLHLLVLVGTRLEDIQLFLNGEDITPRNVLAGPGSGGAIQERGALRDDVVYTRVSLGSRGLLGGVGWFHVYPTRLRDPFQRQQDQHYDGPAAGGPSTS